MMKIFQSSRYGSDANIYFDRDLIQIQDSHLEWLRTQGNAEYVDVPDDSLGRYIGDFFLILMDLDKPPKHFRVIMRLNGLKSPTDYDGTLTKVFIPDLQVLESITQVYLTGRKQLKVGAEQR